MQLLCHKPITDTASFPISAFPGQPWYTIILYPIFLFHLIPAAKNQEGLRSHHHPQHCKEELRYSSKQKFVEWFALSHA